MSATTRRAALLYINSGRNIWHKCSRVLNNLARVEFQVDPVHSSLTS